MLHTVPRLKKQETISAERKLQGMIGLAARAGTVKSGEFAAEQSVRGGKAKLCLLASDASEGSIKKFTDMCGFLPKTRTRKGRFWQCGSSGFRMKESSLRNNPAKTSTVLFIYR